MSTVDKCQIAWSTASDDEERAERLLVIRKYLKSDDNLSPNDQKRIFDMIGYEFLNSLILGENTSDLGEETKKVFKALGFTIYTYFCSNAEIIYDARINTYISALIDTLGMEDRDEVDTGILGEAIDSVALMISSEECRNKLIQRGILSALLNEYTITKDNKPLLLLVKLLLDADQFLVTENQLNSILLALTLDFQEDQTMKKFELCNYINSIILNYHAYSMDLAMTDHLQKGLFDILRSKIGKQQRDAALKLASVAIERFGILGFGDDSEETKLFFTLLIQITSVEICMLLEDKNFEDICQEQYLLSSCYSIMEFVIELMVHGQCIRTCDQNIQQLLNSIKMSFKAIIDFIKVLQSSWDEAEESTLKLKHFTEITVATIRVLSCWLAEETLALQDEVIEVLPFILQICTKFGSDESYRMKETGYFFVVKYFAAPLCHLTAEDRTREVLLQNGLLTIIFDFMESQWPTFVKSLNARKEDQIFVTLCGSLLNIVVLESKSIGQSTQFFTFLKFLFNNLPQLPEKKFITLKANFSVLGLLMTRHFHKKVESCETSFYRFLSSSIKFLWDAHNVEGNDDTTSFVISTEYRRFWDSIMELWYLGMQALSTLLPLMPWLAKFLIESGWPLYIMASFARVNENGLEGNVRSAYQAFLSKLVKVSKEAAAVLMEQDAVVICHKHKMTELEDLLVKLST